MEERKNLTSEVAELKRKLALSGKGNGEAVEAEQINGVSFFVKSILEFLERLTFTG